MAKEPMTVAVLTFLDRLVSSTLFFSVGERLPDRDIVQVRDWNHALESCRSLSWENFQIHRHNEILVRDPNDAEFSKQYNDFIVATRERLDEILLQSTGTIPLDNNGQTDILNCTQWDLMRACIELEYEDIARSTWHRELSEWYLRGRFPCGWEGDWPEGEQRKGRLIVY